MRKFRLTWIADVPAPADFNIIGTGIHMVKVPREFSEIVEAETLEGSLALLQRCGARCITHEEVAE